MSKREQAIGLLKLCLEDWPYAATRVPTIMNRIEKAVAILEKSKVPYTNAGKWISVKDRLPNMDVDVLIYFRWGAFEIGRFNKDPDSLEYRWEFEDFNLYGDDMQDVTHWMPLPEPPKEET